MLPKWSNPNETTKEISWFMSIAGLALLSLAGQEGFEPPTLGFGVRRSTVGATGLYHFFYLVSLCKVCFLQNLQYLLNSNLSGVVRLFLVVV
jgi:hypothetical protein